MDLTCSTGGKCRIRGIGAIGVPDTPETARSVDSYKSVRILVYFEIGLKMLRYLSKLSEKFLEQILRPASN